MFVCLFFKKVNAKGLRSSLLFPHFISNKSCLAWLWWVLRSQISQPGINKILLYIYLSVPLRDRSLQLGQMRSKIYCHTWSLIKTLWSSTKKKKKWLIHRVQCDFIVQTKDFISEEQTVLNHWTPLKVANLLQDTWLMCLFSFRWQALSRRLGYSAHLRFTSNELQLLSIILCLIRL